MRDPGCAASLILHAPRPLAPAPRPAGQEHRLLPNVDADTAYEAIIRFDPIVSWPGLVSLQCPDSAKR